jgi:hypothetical protein
MMELGAIKAFLAVQGDLARDSVHGPYTLSRSSVLIM